MMRSGSSGALSGTASCRLEATHVAHLAQPLCWGKGQNPRDVLEHVGVHYGKGDQLGSKLESRRGQEPAKRLGPRLGLATLDPGYDGLRGLGSMRQLALSESGPRSGLTDQERRFQASTHRAMIAD